MPFPIIAAAAIGPQIGTAAVAASGFSTAAAAGIGAGCLALGSGGTLLIIKSKPENKSEVPRNAVENEIQALEKTTDKGKNKINDIEEKFDNHTLSIDSRLSENEKAFKNLSDTNQELREQIAELRTQINSMQRSRGSRSSSRSSMSRRSESLYDASRPVSPNPNHIPMASTLAGYRQENIYKMPKPSFCKEVTGYSRNSMREAKQEFREESYQEMEGSGVPRLRRQVYPNEHNDLYASSSSNFSNYSLDLINKSEMA